MELLDVADSGFRADAECVHLRVEDVVGGRLHPSRRPGGSEGVLGALDLAPELGGGVGVVLDVVNDHDLLGDIAELCDDGLLLPVDLHGILVDNQLELLGRLVHPKVDPRPGSMGRAALFGLNFNLKPDACI